MRCGNCFNNRDTALRSWQFQSKFVRTNRNGTPEEFSNAGSAPHVTMHELMPCALNQFMESRDAREENEIHRNDRRDVGIDVE